MSYLPQSTTRVVVVKANPLVDTDADGHEYKRLWVVPEGNLHAPLVPFDVLEDGFGFWMAYVRSLTAQGICTRDVVTVINDTEFVFGLSRHLSRTELDVLRTYYPDFNKETA